MVPYDLRFPHSKEIESILSVQSNTKNATVTAASLVRERCELFLVVDVFLMVVNTVVAGAFWISLAFQLIVTAWVLFVLWNAWLAAKVIPPSFPFQRPIGVVLYLLAHSLQFFFAWPLPLWAFGVCLAVIPLAVFFLFEP